MSDTEYRIGKRPPGCTVGGPHGLGDPDDQTLRVVERDVVIPKMMKARANEEKCPDFVKLFVDCSKDSGLFMPFKCRTEAHEMKVCIGKWFSDPTFKAEVKAQYLAERSEYRRTGVGAKQGRKANPGF